MNSLGPAAGTTGPGDGCGPGKPDADRQCGSWLNGCCHITDPRSASCSYDGGALHLYEGVGVP